jgi:hypothetical protein
MIIILFQFSVFGKFFYLFLRKRIKNDGIIPESEIDDFPTGPGVYSHPKKCLDE